MKENSVTVKLVGTTAEIDAVYSDGGTTVTIKTSVSWDPAEALTVERLREVPALMAMQVIKEVHPELVIAQFG